MAKARKTTTTTTTAPVVAARPSIDLIVPMGFVVSVDADLSLRAGEKPTKQRFEHASQTMLARHEDAILAALRSVFGTDRVNYLETADTYTGDPKSGIAKQVRVAEAPIPGMPAPAAAPAPVAPTAPVEPKLEDLTVEELRERAKAAGKKTAGSKAVLIKRLS